MAINTATNFKIGANLPIDDRSVVTNKTDLDSLLAYEGLVSYVTSEKCEYIYKDGEWGKVISVESYSKTETDNLLNNKVPTSRTINGIALDKDINIHSDLITYGEDGEPLSDIISDMQVDIDSKQPTLTAGTNITITNNTISAKDTTYTFNGAVSTIKDNNLTVSRALVSNASGKVGVSAVTSTELGYLDGVTSAIQTQLDNKAPLTSPTIKTSLNVYTGTDQCPVNSLEITNRRHINIHTGTAMSTTNTFDNKTWTYGAFILGNGNTTSANSSKLIGTGLLVNDTDGTKQDKIVLGFYNADTTGTILEIGNGTTTSNRKNALEVYSDKVTIPNAFITNGNILTLISNNASFNHASAESLSINGYLKSATTTGGNKYGYSFTTSNNNSYPWINSVFMYYGTTPTQINLQNVADYSKQLYDTSAVLDVGGTIDGTTYKLRLSTSFVTATHYSSSSYSTVHSKLIEYLNSRSTYYNINNPYPAQGALTVGSNTANIVGIYKASSTELGVVAALGATLTNVVFTSSQLTASSATPKMSCRINGIPIF